MITRCYLEITNRCNLNCVFCPKTTRKAHQLSHEEFETLTNKLIGKIKFLYFHLMGEPFLHPLLPLFIESARNKGFIPILTTNGTLLKDAHEIIKARPHKIQISLQAHEGNLKENTEEYITQVMHFSKAAAEKGIIIVLRLWNEGGGYDSNNPELLRLMAQHIPTPWIERPDGWKVTDLIYLETDSTFEWPDAERAPYEQSEAFCHALRNQIGVLVDGTVVPCCLDSQGAINLGNLHHQSLDEILSSPRARNLYDSFSRHQTSEPLCQTCGYALINKRFRK
ncbi:MAG: SPASM domain-containing protein [Bacteroidaceae bacterium]|nr:SPASM domain-containing protein [Bacteroidaceae bacterium]